MLLFLSIPDAYMGLAVFILFLTVHLIANINKWYYTYPDVDVITHFLGGLSLSVFLKRLDTAIFLIILWEVIEFVLIKKGSPRFRETLENKLRDFLFGLMGFLLGLALF